MVKRGIRLSLALFIALVLVTSVVAGCLGPAKGEVFELGYLEPASLDPALAEESPGIRVIKQVCDGLIDYDTDTLEVKPAVAESWEVNETATVWTFHLKRGVKFHNGRECKAQDFVYSWNRVVDPDTGSNVAYHLAPIKGFDKVQDGKAKGLEGLKAVDDYTLRVTLDYSLSEFITTLGHSVFSPVPKEAVKRWGNKFGEHLVGNGPFKLKSWKHDREVVLERNDDYYGEEARVEKMVLKIFADDEAAFLEFKAGKLDAVSIPPEKIGWVKKSKKYKDYLITKPTLFYSFYLLNMDAEVWKKKKVRQALNYVVDRKAICRTIYENTYQPATGIVPKGIPGYKKGAMKYKKDLAKAKKLLEEAGYPNGRGLPKITLGYDSGYSDLKLVAEAIQADAKKVGFNIEISGLEFGALMDKVTEGEMDIFDLGGWGADYPIMDNFLYPIYYSKSGDNLGKYKNKKVDRLLDRAKKETLDEERYRLYRKAEKIILNDAPVVPIAFPIGAWVTQPGVREFNPTAMGDYPLEQVWLSK